MAQLFHEVNRFANVLRKKGIRRGDCVAVYLPMIPELVISMLACARIGALHNVVFGGFSAQALRARIQDSSCTAFDHRGQGCARRQIRSPQGKCGRSAQGLPFG